MSKETLLGSLDGFGVTGPNSILSSLSLAISKATGTGELILRSGGSITSYESLFCALGTGDDSELWFGEALIASGGDGALILGQFQSPSAVTLLSPIIGESKWLEQSSTRRKIDDNFIG